MIALTTLRRRELRAQAHALHPVVSVGQHGLTARVMHEIDVALRAHGLIKVRVFSEDRVQRETMLERIADELAAAPVQHLGKLLILWRPPEDQPVKPADRSARKPRKERGPAGLKQPSNERGPRKPRELHAAGRRARGAASAEDARSEPDSRRRRRVATTKRLPRSGDDAQLPGVRRRRHAAATADSSPGKRAPRESAFGASSAKPASDARRRRSPSSLETARTPTGKSAPNPRRRRRAG